VPQSSEVPPLTLGADFPEATEDQWLAAVDRALRGADFERTLVSRTLDAIRIEPLYTADDVATEHDEAGFPGFAPLLRAQGVVPRLDGSWDVRAKVTHPEPARASAQALVDLRGGATSLDVEVDAGGGRGVSCRGVGDLDQVLAGVLLHVAAVSLRAGAYGDVVADWLVELWAERGVAGTQVGGCLGLDPLGALAADGELPQGLDPALAAAVAHARRAAQATPHVRALRASGLVAAHAGASEGQEIGFVLAAATAYLRALVDAGLPPTTAARQITLEVFADVDLFSTIAKIRALRHCWATVLRTSGIDGGDLGVGVVSVDAVAGGRWLTVVDPWVNLLRGTTAALGAVLGGADAVIVDAYDAARGPGGGHGHRLARNTQLLLRDESGVGRVLDPAGGSYYVESLTDALAAAGWAVFVRHEAAGGLASALESGSVADEIGRTADERAGRIATRRHPITGVSEYPLLGERRPEPVPTPPPDARPPVRLVGTPTVAPALTARRLSEPFERLRAAAEPSGAAVFLANIGTGAGFVPRATFAANLFGAGGVRVVGEGGYPDAPTMASAFAAARTPVAIICGTDDAYAEHAGAYARTLKAAGARYVYLAGRSGEREQEYREAGVDEFVGLGVDALAVLGRLHEVLGVRS